MNKGIVINEKDTIIDLVLAKADAEGNIIMRQGDDHIIMSPSMMSKLCEAYNKFVERAKHVVSHLLTFSMIGGIMLMRLNLWESNYYGIKLNMIMDLMQFQ